MDYDRDGKSDPGQVGWQTLAGRTPNGGRVLIVEDDSRVRSLLIRAVRALGYEVTGAGSAEEADPWIASQRFDIALLDIELPRMNGIEFLQWAQRRDPEMAAIMLTGRNDPELAVQCLEQGARTYLVKPVDLEFLRLALKDAMAVRWLLVERNRMAAAQDTGPVHVPD